MVHYYADKPLIGVSLILGILGAILSPLLWLLLFTRTALLNYWFAWSATGGPSGYQSVFQQVVLFGTLALLFPLGATVTGYLGNQRLPFEERCWSTWLGRVLGIILSMFSLMCLLGVLAVLLLAGLFDFY